MLPEVVSGGATTGDPEERTATDTGHGDNLMAMGLTPVDPGPSGVRRSAKACNQLNPPRSARCEAYRLYHPTVTSSGEVWRTWVPATLRVAAVAPTVAQIGTEPADLLRSGRCGDHAARATDGG